MSNGYVLLVEDNADDEELTIDALRSGGVSSEIVVARDGAEELERLYGVSDSASPQLILLDLRLPKIPGHEVLRRIRSDSRTKHIPTVVLTSSNEESDIRTSYENGANSYVRKPVEFEHFVRAVQHLGVYWLLFNERPA